MWKLDQKRDTSSTDSGTTARLGVLTRNRLVANRGRLRPMVAPRTTPVSQRNRGSLLKIFVKSPNRESGSRERSVTNLNMACELIDQPA